MCQILGIDMKLSPPIAAYDHVWGVNCDRERRIRYTWYLTLFNILGLPTTIPFDLVEGSSPVIIGLDIEKYGNTNKMHARKCFEFKRPQDKHIRKFFTYISKDANGDERI